MWLAWSRYKAVSDIPTQRKVGRQTEEGRIQGKGEKDKKDKDCKETNNAGYDK